MILISTSPIILSHIHNAIIPSHVQDSIMLYHTGGWVYHHHLKPMVHLINYRADDRFFALHLMFYQGAGTDVPAYLRFEGQVRNRHLGKRETSLLVKDIWKQRIEHKKVRM